MSQPSDTETDKDDIPAPSSSTANLESDRTATPSLHEDVFFIFGPNQSYFTRLGSRWWFHGAAPTAETLDDNIIEDTFVFPLGPRNHNFYAAFRSRSGKLGWRSMSPSDEEERTQMWSIDDPNDGRDNSGDKWKLQHSRHGSIWKVFSKWVKDNTVLEEEALNLTSVTIGKNNAFYERTPSKVFWNNLPPSLVEKI